VKVGQRVKRGDDIAATGSTGRSTGPHLHYEVLVHQKCIDPIKYILEESKVF
jgi:murein DD-endopeptidase MepM/ murein hydrolase activator NlpD